MKFINKLQKFMYGRYGIDELYKFFIIIYIIIILLNLYFKNNILSILELIIIFIIFYRALSKDIIKRKKENNKYLKIKNIFLKKYKDKNYIYKKCSKCKTILKLPLPYEIGIKHTKCPKCKHKNRILILRKQKIEIIKNNKAK